ncbi:hypothetical protein PENSPDRAFT_627695 [Peniophora sp. CONT]|nr:hypothetical protein PENSPDRAFT_627695 [Peniophora sp. CONT]
MDDLEAISELLTKLSNEPYDLPTHIQHIDLAATAGEEEGNEAREMFTAYWAAGDEVWMPLIDAKKRSSNIDSVSGAQEVHELYDKAEGDYLSIPLLKAHAEFLVARRAHFSADGDAADSADAFSTPWTRMMLKSVMTRAAKDISRSNEVWMVIHDWEMEMLESANANQKALLIEEIDDLHLTRLKQLHADSDETFQSYSTFTSNNRSPAEYEEILVQASKQRATAVKAYQFRESYETALIQAGYSLDAYAQYAAYERRAKKPDFVILSGIYERAIAEAAKRRFAGEYGAEEALRAFWTGYGDALRIHRDDEDNQLLVFQRAVRSVPGYGEIWAKYIRFAEANPALIVAANAEDVEALYTRAFATKRFNQDPEEIVPLVLARAGYEKRMLLSDQGDAETRLGNLLTVLEDGLQRVREASKTGDPRFRIERFFVELHKFTDNHADAAEVWGAAARHYKTNYTPWIAYAETLMLANDFPGADAALSKASTAPHMDWPEAIWEAWIALHHSHGTLDSLNKCLDTVEWERHKVNTKRARAAEKAAQEAAQYQQVAEPAKDVIMSDAGAGVTESPMDVDQQPATQSLKRKAEESLGADDAKKSRSDAPLKRDRENCTVFVRELPAGTTEDQLNKLFKDCGGIRDIKLTKLPNSLVATVEFADSSSVPAALTKDKKRIDGVEVAVHLAWQSTLYVTNFPESVDDAAIRETFSKYGELFDVRWPSKKFKNTRRFCYIQYTSPAAAKEALMMHGIELESGMPLSVYISNPERKKERTDANANAKEVYVAGLSKFTTKEDLDKRFKAYGRVKEIRVPLDEQGRSKGFAFIEFETEADAVKALGANNEDLKGRRIAVTIADARVRSAKKEPDSGLGRRADAATRSLRVLNLPQTTHDASTTEGLLQQAFEKHVPVKRLEVFADKREAIVEFETAADAAKLLLQPDAITLEGKPLKITDNLGTSSNRAVPTAFVPRKAAAPKPRAGLGARKAVPAATPKPADGIAQASGEASRPAAGKAQDDFRKMLLGGK